MRRRLNGPGFGFVRGMASAGVAAVALACSSLSGAAPRPESQTPFHIVDLEPFATRLAADAPAARQFDRMPAGRQVYHRVPFQVGTPLAVTGLESARDGEFHPAEVNGIVVARKARRLHLLLTSLGADKDGTPLAKVVIHYAGGKQESMRLGYGVHVRNWMKTRTEKSGQLLDPNSQVAWSEGDGDDRTPDSRLFHTALENPWPDELVTSIDVVSLFSRAALVLFACTVEGSDSTLPPGRPLPARRLVRAMNEFPDAAYRADLRVRVTDGPNGTPLTNAIAALAIRDDRQSFYLGEARVETDGTCRLAYPPQQTLAFDLLVRAPGRVPAVLSEARTHRPNFSRELTAVLAPGVLVGGIVKAPDGKPVAGAEIVLHKVVRVSSREFTRTDYDTVITDSDGRWSSRSLPKDFDGFAFQVAHPDYRPALYVMPGQEAPGAPARDATTPPPRSSFQERLEVIRLTDGEAARRLGPPMRTSAGRALPTVTSNALLSATAEMVLQPAILVAGTVRDSDGKALPATDMIFQRNNPTYERKRLKTDDQGRFRLMAPEPGDGALIVLRAGHTPMFHPFNIVPSLQPMDLVLAPGRTLRGRVIDRNQRPVPGARVRLDDWQGTGDLLRFQALTDSNGRFAWTNAPSDQIMLYVSKSNYYTMRQSASGSDELTLYLNRPPGVAGRVYDADTKQPIDPFVIIKGRKYSSNDETIHWERYDSERGRNGEYTIRVEEYYFRPEARLMVEAPGYIPQISRGFQQPDSYTNDFALKKGKGISGVVQTADGQPAANATLVLVGRNEEGYMDTAGQFRSTSSGGDMIRSDSRGRFEFSPKLEADWILVAHDKGFAETRAGPIESEGRIVLQPWSRVTGVMRVGDKPEPDQTVRLQRRYERYPENGGRSSALSLYLKAEPDESGRFVFEKVPPGPRQVFVEYRFKERQYGETPLSHGLPLNLRPGETADVTLGGSGRKVTGRIQVIGGDVSDVDWRRDVHKLTLLFPDDPIKPPDMSQPMTPEVRQKAWEEFNRRQRAFWPTDAGRARELAERTYVLVFDTNGQFRADHVPPGRYQLSIVANDPEEEYYRQRTIGSLNQEIVVPDVPGAKVNEPFDVGSLDLTIRGKLRIGKAAPPLETKMFDGQPVKLSDFRGKLVLLFFWATYAGTGSFDLQVLKEMHNTFGKEDKLVVLGLSLDADPKAAAEFTRNNGMAWPQAHLGEWGQTQVPAAFGVDGIPTGVLIDAEGRLAARNLRGSGIRTAIRKALTSGPSAANTP